MSTPQFAELPLSAVVESAWNPRRHFDAAKLEELAASIREKGVVEPIVVRSIADRRYEIVAGARRYRASRLAHVATIPAVIRELDDVAALELAVVENQQRDDIHPLDEAEGYQALLKAGTTARGYSVAVVAAKVGKSESYVYRRLKLLDLEEDLQQALAEDRLSVAHAERLLRLPPALRKEAADPENGVVWRHSPLLTYRERWVPQREDLRPVHELEHFIRQRHHFDAAARETQLLQPELAEQLQEVIAPPADDEDDDADLDEPAPTALVSLSLDPMARMRLRAGKNDPIPLTPSKWREVTSEKARCPHTVKGVITHGGPPRVLDVCTTKRCTKHFPPAKKKATTKATAAPRRDDWAEQQRREKEAREAWQTLRPIIGRAFAAALAQAPVTPLVLAKDLLNSHALKDLREEYGLSLTADTAVHCLLIHDIDDWSFEAFAAATKTWGFDAKAWRKAYEKQKAAEAKGTLDEQRKTLAAKGAAKQATKGGRS